MFVENLVEWNRIKENRFEALLGAHCFVEDWRKEGAAGSAWLSLEFQSEVFRWGNPPSEFRDSIGEWEESQNPSSVLVSRYYALDSFSVETLAGVAELAEKSRHGQSETAWVAQLLNRLIEQSEPAYEFEYFATPRSWGRQLILRELREPSSRNAPFRVTPVVNQGLSAVG
jgi:hypothetical protein